MADSNRTERRLLDSIRKAKAGEDAPAMPTATSPPGASTGAAATKGDSEQAEPPRPATGTGPRATSRPAPKASARRSNKATAAAATGAGKSLAETSAATGAAAVDAYQRFPRIWPD